MLLHIFKRIGEDGLEFREFRWFDTVDQAEELYALSRLNPMAREHFTGTFEVYELVIEDDTAPVLEHRGIIYEGN